MKIDVRRVFSNNIQYLEYFPKQEEIFYVSNGMGLVTPPECRIFETRIEINEFLHRIRYRISGVYQYEICLEGFAKWMSPQEFEMILNQL